MPYRLKRYQKRVRRQLRDLPHRIRDEVPQLILDLQHDPYPPGSELLRDQYQDIYKIKIDGWRIFYRVDEQDRTIDIVSVKRRTPNTYTSLFSLLR